jgi:hypothetical protein
MEAAAVQVMNEREMVALMRDLEPGTLLLITYDAAYRAPPKRPRRVPRPTKVGERREAGMAKAQLAGLPSNVYLARFLGMRANGRREVCLDVFVLNRGEGGERRSFNPSAGVLHGIFVVPAEQPRRAPRPARAA